GAGRDVQAGFDGIAVAQRDADTGVSADQAAFTDGNDDVAATGQRAHGGAAAAEVRALADEDTRRDASFDHAGAFSAGVEVDEAFVHHRGAFADVGAQANARTVGDAYAGRHHVVGHLGKLVDRIDFQQVALQTRFQLALGQLGQVHGALVGPGDVGQQREDAGEVHAVRLDQAVG